MGVVYRAEDLKLKRTVALKFLSAQAIGSREETKRFVHEAQAAAALDHPNICTVYEIEEIDDRTFIVMAFVEGQSLKERIESGPLKIEEVLDIATQVTEGIQEAHEKGIVHRDIKPGNILLTSKGQVKITDFGLAKLPDATKLTKSGTTLGTISYMSPEQAQGEEIDHRTDLWSLGIVLYECLAGRPPFKSEYEQAMIYSIIYEEPAQITGIRSGVPLELEMLVNKLLAKDPAERYQHADEILTDLHRIRKAIESGAAHHAPVKPGKKRSLFRHPAFVTSVIIAACVILVILFYRSGESFSFDERDWLLITSIENHTDEEVFDKALNEAIAIDMQQSRWVNVFDRTRIKQTLRRMEKNDVTAIDESLGLEICKREGVKAMLVPTISRVGETYSLSASMVDVGRGRRLNPIRVTVTGRDEVLKSAVDRLTREIRKDLGESLESIEENDKSLPKVTTSSLAALEQYALGVEKHLRPLDWNEVKIFLHNAIELDSTFASAYAALGTLCDNNGEREKAIEYYTKAVRYIDNLTEREKYKILAEYYNLVESDFKKAIQNYKTLLEMYPDYVGAQNNLGWTYQRAGKYDEALAAYDEALRIDPQFVLPLNNIITIYLNMREYDKVIETAWRLVDIDSTYAMGYLSLGRAYNGKGMFDESIKYLENAVRLESNNAWIYFHLGRAYTGNDLYDKAISALQRSVEIYPQNAWALTSLAYAYARTGSKADATGTEEKALQINRNPYNLLDMVCIHSLLHEADGAFRYLEEAIESGFNDHELLANDGDLEFIRSDPRFEKYLEMTKENSVK